MRSKYLLLSLPGMRRLRMPMICHLRDMKQDSAVIVYLEEVG